MKKTVPIILLLLAFCYPAVKSLLSKGGYTSHDLTHHVARQIDMDKLLTEGQFPPRWSGDLSKGYGYPLFLFNYPTPSIFGEGLHKLRMNFVESVKAIMMLSVLASVIGMYLFMDSLLPGRKLSSFLASIFYVYAPIRFVNLYVSASVGACLAMGILPFVFWLIVKLKDKKGWATFTGAITIALLITSHNVTALLFAPVIAAFILVMYFSLGKSNMFLKRVIVTVLLGLGLSAFFWLPVIVEKKFTVYDQIMKNSWVNQFPTLNEILHSPWGYGLARPGKNEAGSMSFQIGLTQIAVMGMLLATMFLYKMDKRLLKWGIFSLFVFGISVFFMNSISTVFWKIIPFLYLVQFPFRFLNLSSFAASMGAGVLLQYLPFKKIFFAGLIVLVLYANRNHINVNQSIEPGDSYYLDRWMDVSSYEEHLPIWAKTPESEATNKISILKGNGQVLVTESKSAKVKADIILSEASVIRFNQFYFPGWRFTDNGNQIVFLYSEEESKGLPVFELGKGEHKFEAVFGDTIDRKIADTVSLISVGLSGITLWYYSRKQGKKVV